jgi:hypothetical protein
MTDAPMPEEIPEVLPVSESQRGRPACPHCGCEDLTPGLKLGWSEGVGPYYYPRPGSGVLGFRAVAEEPLLAQLCRRCGTVARLFVQHPDREWASMTTGRQGG